MFIGKLSPGVYFYAVGGVDEAIKLLLERLRRPTKGVSAWSTTGSSKNAAAVYGGMMEVEDMSCSKHDAKACGFESHFPHF